MTTRITWVTNNPPELIGGEFVSDVASTRYRVLIPVKQLESRDYESVILAVTGEKMGDTALLSMKTDIVVFSKSYYKVNEHLAYIARGVGAKVVCDICDNHYEDSKHEAHFHNLTRMAHAVTCNTGRMHDKIKEFFPYF